MIKLVVCTVLLALALAENKNKKESHKTLRSHSNNHHLSESINTDEPLSTKGR